MILVFLSIPTVILILEFGLKSNLLSMQEILTHLTRLKQPILEHLGRIYPPHSQTQGQKSLVVLNLIDSVGKTW